MCTFKLLELQDFRAKPFNRQLYMFMFALHKIDVVCQDNLVFIQQYEITDLNLGFNPLTLQSD